VPFLEIQEEYPFIGDSSLKKVKIESADIVYFVTASNPNGNDNLI